MMDVEVVEFTDPGCSWAWGTEPKLRLLCWRFGDRVRWRRVMGGLIGDMENIRPGFDPVRAAPRQIGYWENVSKQTGMPYPVRLGYLFRSTEPAGRAVKAAEVQGEDVAQRVLRRLREATFIIGAPPDSDESILGAVAGVHGLDPDRFAKDLASESVDAAFRADWEETRRPNEYVMNLDESPDVGGGRAKNSEGHWRYVFPTVLFRAGDEEITVAGWKPYEAYQDALARLSPSLASSPAPDPSPDELFATWPTAAPRELGVLCGAGANVPSGVVAHDWGAGVFYMTADEASSRALS